MRAFAHAQTDGHTHAQTHTRTNRRTHKHTHVHKQTYTQTYTHTNRRTHKEISPRGDVGAAVEVKHFNVVAVCGERSENNDFSSESSQSVFSRV